ncbi:hypothetical protein THAOC_01349, partial [Thalassiosira oceanica]
MSSCLKIAVTANGLTGGWGAPHPVGCTPPAVRSSSVFFLPSASPFQIWGARDVSNLAGVPPAALGVLTTLSPSPLTSTLSPLAAGPTVPSPTVDTNYARVRTCKPVVRPVTTPVVGPVPAPGDGHNWPTPAEEYLASTWGPLFETNAASVPMPDEAARPSAMPSRPGVKRSPGDPAGSAGTEEADPENTARRESRYEAPTAGTADATLSPTATLPTVTPDADTVPLWASAPDSDSTG